MTTQPARVTIGRRTFVGYVVAGATLVAAADLGTAPAGPACNGAGRAPARRALRPQRLPHRGRDADREPHHGRGARDGTASFALPRMEVGQGITTSTAMLIAEELELPLDRVRVTLADARPELVWNQLTGGSNTTISTYTPVRVAAAVAKQALLEAAAIQLGDTVANLVARGRCRPGARRAVADVRRARPSGREPDHRAVDVRLKDPRSSGSSAPGSRGSTRWRR